MRHGPLSTARTLSSYHPVCNTFVPAERDAFTNHSPYQRVHLRRLNVPQFLHSVLDLPFIRLDINKEYERVIFLNLLHRGLSVEWAAKQVKSVAVTKNRGTVEIRTRRWCDIDPCVAGGVYSYADTWDPVANAEFLVGGKTRSCAPCGQSGNAHPAVRLSSQSWPWFPVSRLFRR